MRGFAFAVAMPQPAPTFWKVIDEDPGSRAMPYFLEGQVPAADSRHDRSRLDRALRLARYGLGPHAVPTRPVDPTKAGSPRERARSSTAIARVSCHAHIRAEQELALQARLSMKKLSKRALRNEPDAILVRLVGTP